MRSSHHGTKTIGDLCTVLLILSNGRIIRVESVSQLIPTISVRTVDSDGLTPTLALNASQRPKVYNASQSVQAIIEFLINCGFSSLVHSNWGYHIKG